MVTRLGVSRTDLVLRALSDPTRRDIVGRTLCGDHSVSALAQAYPMSFAAVQKHVSVLHRAGLVTKHRSGREQIVRGRPQALHEARGELERLEDLWRGRLDRFGDVLADLTPEGAP